MEPSAEDLKMQETVVPLKTAVVKMSEPIQAATEPTVEPVMVNGSLEEDMAHFPAAAEADDAREKNALDAPVIAAAAAAEADLPPVNPPLPTPVEVAKTSVEEGPTLHEAVTAIPKPKPKKAAVRKPKADTVLAENGSDLTKVNSTSAHAPEVKAKRQRKRKSDPDFIEDPRLGRTQTVNGEVVPSAESDSATKVDSDVPPKPKKKKVAPKKAVPEKPKKGNSSSGSSSGSKKRGKSPAKPVPEGKNLGTAEEKPISMNTMPVEQGLEQKEQTGENSTQKAQNKVSEASNKTETTQEVVSSTDYIKDLQAVPSVVAHSTATGADSNSIKKSKEKKEPGKKRVAKPKDPTKKAPAKPRVKVVSKSPEKKDKPAPLKKKKTVKKAPVSDLQAVPTVDSEKVALSTAADQVEFVPQDITKTSVPTGSVAPSTQEKVKPKKKYTRKKKDDTDPARKTQDAGGTTKNCKEGSSDTKVSNAPLKRKPAKKKPKVVTTGGSAGVQTELSNDGSPMKLDTGVQSRTEKAVEGKVDKLPDVDRPGEPKTVEGKKDSVGKMGAQLVDAQRPVAMASSTNSSEPPKKPKKKKKPKPPADSKSENNSASSENKTNNASVTGEVGAESAMSKQAQEVSKSLQETSKPTQGEPSENKDEKDSEEQGKFPCSQCSYQGKNKASLLKHLKNHHGIFQCSHCNFTSSTKDAMDEHMKSHPSSKWGKRKCSKCIRFINPSEFEEHEKTCTGKPDPIACPHCPKVFRFKALFEAHLKMHLAPKPPAAPKPSSTKPQPSKPGPKKCHKCGRRFSVDELESHTNGCDGTPTNFVCPECKKEFHFMAKLKSHMKIHLKHEDMEFACDICDYKTPFFGYLEKHMGNMHNKDREKTVPCPDCNKLFYTTDNMKNHVRYSCVTTNLQKCDVCGKTVKSVDAMRRHKVSHEEAKNVACTVEGCTLAFKTKREQTYHYKNVHGDPPKKFVCSHADCSESFPKKSQLTRHESTHDGDRKYKCPYDGCGKAFRHPDNLKVHTLQHTDEKPIKCEHCEYRCRQRSSIQHHMRTKHPKVPLPSSTRSKSADRESKEMNASTKKDSDTSGSQSDASSSCKDVYAFDEEDGMASLPPLQKNPSRSPRPKSLLETPLAATLLTPPKEAEPKAAKPKKERKKKADSTQSGEKDNSDKPPPKKKKKTAEVKANKKKPKTPEKAKEEEPKEDPVEATPEKVQEEPAPVEANNEDLDNITDPSLEASLTAAGETSGELLSDSDPYEIHDRHLDTGDQTVHDDELPADFDPEKHMAEAFGDIAEEMGPVDDPSRPLDSGQYPPTTVGETGDFVPPLHGITEPVTGEALVEKIKEDFSEEQLEQLAKETQEELNAVMSGNMGAHTEDTFPTGVEVPVITSHHQVAPPSVEYSAPSSNVPPPSHEAPSSIPPPSNEPVPSQESYPMSHDSQPNFSAFSGDAANNQPDGSAANPRTDPAVSDSSLPPYSSAVPYTEPFPHLSPTSSAGPTNHNTALSSSYTTPLSSPYLSPSYPMPLPSSLPGYDSSTYTQPTTTSRSEQPLTTNSEGQAPINSRAPESLYTSSSRTSTSTTTTAFPTDTFSRELFGQYFQDPSNMPLTHPPMSQDPQRPSYLPQQQPGFPMLPRTNTDLLRGGPMMPGSNYSSLMNPAAALGQQHGQQSWLGDERSRTWGQPSPIIMGPPPPELGTGSPLTATSRNPYSDRPEYSFDPNASSQLGRRPGESGFPIPQTLSNPSQHYDVAYMTARSLNPSSQETSYSRGSSSNTQNRFEDAYRHMTDYRTLPQPPSMVDMYGRMGMNPALGLDKYYYPTRDAMYRSQHIAPTTNPFLPQTSTAQMGYTDREYGRNAGMYSQHSAYGFMGDKQFLPSSKITPGVPSAADYFPARPGATDPHIQDPYRRIYNMMSRYY